MFIAWARGASAGDSAVYYTGFLATDCGPPRACPNPDEIKLCALRDAAWELSELGLVNLSQQKICAGEYRYLAQRTRVSVRAALPA